MTGLLAAAIGTTASAPATAATHVNDLDFLSPPISISSPEANPEALSCPSNSFCAATDLSGDVITSSNPAGGTSAWSTAHVAGSTPSLRSISCPSSSFCAAAGVADEPPEFTPYSEVWTSTNPSGGASAWHGAVIGGETYAKSISCPSASFCAVVAETLVEGEPHGVRSELWTSTDPTGGASTWHAVAIDAGNQLNAVDCPTAGLCVAVDEEGNVLTSTSPASGASAWSAPEAVAARVNGTPVALNAVSCVGVSFCTASDGYDYLSYEGPSSGNLVTSFDPTGGAGAWSASPTIADALFSLSCPIVAECLSVDYSGNVYLTVAGELGAFGWEHQSVEPDDYSRVFVATACPSTERCYVLDSDGNLIVGRPYEEVEDETLPPPKDETTSGGGGTGSTSSGGGGTSSTSSGGGSSSNTSKPPPDTGGLDGPPRIPTVSSAQLSALLKQQLVPHGKTATIRSILKHGGLTMPFTAPVAGTLRVSWFLAPRGAAARSASNPVLIASGRVIVSAGSPERLTIRLTGAGKRRLTHAHRLSVSVTASFTPIGSPAVAASTQTSSTLSR
jgi:uncharacterized membrane protein YgcG